MIQMQRYSRASTAVTWAANRLNLQRLVVVAVVVAFGGAIAIDAQRFARIRKETYANGTICNCAGFSVVIVRDVIAGGIARTNSNAGEAKVCCAVPIANVATALLADSISRSIKGWLAAFAIAKFKVMLSDRFFFALLAHQHNEHLCRSVAFFAGRFVAFRVKDFQLCHLSARTGTETGSQILSDRPAGNGYLLEVRRVCACFSCNSLNYVASLALVELFWCHAKVSWFDLPILVKH